MFSDTHRYLKMFLLTAILLLLCLYNYGEAKRMMVKLETCLTTPEKFDSREVVLEGYVYVSSISKDRFEIEQEGKRISVMGAVDGLAPGDEIAIRAIFHGQGYMTLQELHIIKLRIVKIIISIAAALFVVVLFLRRYRFTLRDFQFAERI